MIVEPHWVQVGEELHSATGAIQRTWALLPRGTFFLRALKKNQTSPWEWTLEVGTLLMLKKRLQIAPMRTWSDSFREAIREADNEIAALKTLGWE